MSIRSITTLPAPVLRRKARPVTRFDADLQTLVDDMVETMRAAPGVGLAAPQVGVSERVIVVEYAEDEDENEEQVEEAPKKLFVMINPEIKKVSAETELALEACLSIPGLQGEVERSLEITIKGQNRRGQVMKVKARGWLARIFQHEIDHLDGILYTDRATRVWQPTGPVEDNV
ncbi:MAG: peptide deformylase [Anaerolineales bacterium]|nr:peptide deformylase [Anaerolineales bacterium]